MPNKIFQNTNIESIVSKIVVIGAPLIASGVGLNLAIKHALKGDYGTTVLAGLCTILGAYTAGVYTERLR